MKFSKNDTYIYSIWVKLLILYFLMFLASAILPFVAMFPDLGFPCYFVTLVNYSALNLTTMTTAKHLTPMLFLEGPEMFTYIVYSGIVDLISVTYYILGAIAILVLKKHIRGLTILSSWITILGSPTLLFMGFLKLWLVQLFVHVLSFKNILMAAFIYALHFFLSFIYMQCYITKLSAMWHFSLSEKSITKSTLLFFVTKYLNPICTNLHLSVLALEMLIFCLSIMMAIGNSFYVLVADITLGAINLYLCLTIIWYILTECWLHKYSRYMYGFYIGVVCTTIILVLPLLRYENIFMESKLRNTVSINIAMIPTCAIAALIVRILRVTKTREVPYSAIGNPLPLYNVNKPQKKLKQQHYSPPIMEESDDDEEYL
uniref:Glycoprotein M n=1 Tax=Dasyurid herpesvirus 3 TaxID=2529495 RepID=A0A481W689_9VIRU|nr:glycoprotein M [Dasyurid herpesvirus 3]